APLGVLALDGLLAAPQGDPRPLLHEAPHGLVPAGGRARPRVRAHGPRASAHLHLAPDGRDSPLTRAARRARPAGRRRRSRARAPRPPPAPRGVPCPRAPWRRRPSRAPRPPAPGGRPEAPAAPATPG